MALITTQRILLSAAALFVSSSSLVAGVMLEEPATDDRVYSVRCRLQVEGKIRTAAPQGQAVVHALKVDGRMSFLERRLAAAGRDSHALRSLRSYEMAEARIDVGERRTASRLPDSRRLIVAEGRIDGVRHWSTAGPMTAEGINLLRAPGDSLALLALLPDSEIEADSSWNPPGWVVQTLTGVEAVTETGLTCRIESLDDRFAVIGVEGRIEGATLGALTTIDVTGKIAFDIKSGNIRQAQITQKEKRAVGTVTPGMDVTATMYVDRQLSASSGKLTDALVDTIPINAEAAQLSVAFFAAPDLYLLLDRRWHVFHQTDDVAVLRLVEGGSLVAQCNVSRLPPASPGGHTPEQQFIGDIQRALGSQLREVTKAETVTAGDDLWVYRVQATGLTREVPMEWYYYLCAAPDGRQIACVFSIESRLAETLTGRDLELVRSVRFLAPAARTAESSSPVPQ